MDLVFIVLVVFCGVLLTFAFFMIPFHISAIRNSIEGIEKSIDKFLKEYETKKTN